MKLITMILSIGGPKGIRRIGSLMIHRMKTGHCTKAKTTSNYSTIYYFKIACTASTNLLLFLQLSVTRTGGQNSFNTEDSSSGAHSM